jgi:hypothetical protein
MTDAELDGQAITLTTHDMASPVWVKLKKYMEARLQSLRIRNESDLDPIATAKLRGEARAIKNLLALSEKAQALVADEESTE